MEAQQLLSASKFPLLSPLDLCMLHLAYYRLPYSLPMIRIWEAVKFQLKYLIQLSQVFDIRLAFLPLHQLGPYLFQDQPHIVLHVKN